MAPSLNMLTHSAFFPLPRTKANILLDLIRVSSFSGSSFARKQNEVFYNTEDHTALLFSSFDFNCPFFFFSPSLFSPSHSSCTSAFVSGRLCLDVLLGVCILREGGGEGGRAMLWLYPMLGMLSVESEAQGRQAWWTIWGEHLRSTTKSWRSGALLCSPSPADL